MIQNSLPYLPIEIQCDIFKQVDVKDLLHCKESCAKVNFNISSCFKENQPAFSNIFRRAKQCPQILAPSIGELQIYLKGSILIDKLHFEIFMTLLVHKIVDKLPLSPEEEDRISTKTLSISDPEIATLLSDCEFFNLLDSFGLSKFMVEKVSERYLEGNSQEFNRVAELVSKSMHTLFHVGAVAKIFDALFHNFKKFHIDNYRTIVTIEPGSIHLVCEVLANYDVEDAFESDEMRALNPLNIFLKAHIPGHPSLEKKIAKEFIPAMKELAVQLNKV